MQPCRRHTLAELVLLCTRMAPLRCGLNPPFISLSLWSCKHVRALCTVDNAAANPQQAADAGVHATATLSPAAAAEASSSAPAVKAQQAETTTSSSAPAAEAQQTKAAGSSDSSSSGRSSWTPEWLRNIIGDSKCLCCHGQVCNRHVLWTMQHYSRT